MRWRYSIVLVVAIGGVGLTSFAGPENEDVDSPVVEYDKDPDWASIKTEIGDAEVTNGQPYRLRYFVLRFSGKGKNPAQWSSSFFFQVFRGKGTPRRFPKDAISKPTLVIHRAKGDAKGADLRHIAHAVYGDFGGKSLNEVLDYVLPMESLYELGMGDGRMSVDNIAFELPQVGRRRLRLALAKALELQDAAQGQVEKDDEFTIEYDKDLGYTSISMLVDPVFLRERTPHTARFVLHISGVGRAPHEWKASFNFGLRRQEGEPKSFDARARNKPILTAFGPILEKPEKNRFYEADKVYDGLTFGGSPSLSEYVSFRLPLAEMLRISQGEGDLSVDKIGCRLTPQALHRIRLAIAKSLELTE